MKSQRQKIAEHKDFVIYRVDFENGDCKLEAVFKTTISIPSSTQAAADQTPNALGGSSVLTDQLAVDNLKQQIDRDIYT